MKTKIRLFAITILLIITKTTFSDDGTLSEDSATIGWHFEQAERRFWTGDTQEEVLTAFDLAIQSIEGDDEDKCFAFIDYLARAEQDSDEKGSGGIERWFATANFMLARMLNACDPHAILKRAIVEYQDVTPRKRQYLDKLLGKYGRLPDGSPSIDFALAVAELDSKASGAYITILIKETPLLALELMLEAYGSDLNQYERDEILARSRILFGRAEDLKRLSASYTETNLLRSDVNFLLQTDYWWVKLYLIGLAPKIGQIYSDENWAALQEESHHLVKESLANFSKAQKSNWNGF